MDKQEIGRLVEQFKAGDHDAFQVLYDLTRPQAYFVAIKITKSEEDALDILQDSYIKAWEKLNTLEKPESFVPWFNQIVANAAKNYVCKAQPLLFSSEDDETAALNYQEETDEDFLPEKSLTKKESRRIVQEILDELPEDKKLCVILRHYEDMSTTQIAQALNISEGTVKSRLHYAHAKIKERVESLNKRGVTLFTGAALPFFIWLLGQYATTVRMGRRESALLFRHIVAGSSIAAAGATAGSAATAATAATAAATETTTAAAATTAAATAAAGTGGTVAAAAAALTVPKVAAIVAAGVMVVSGAAVGTKKVLNNKRAAEPTAIVTEATAAVAQTEERQLTTAAEETAGESTGEASAATQRTTIAAEQTKATASLNAVPRANTATTAPMRTTAAATTAAAKLTTTDVSTTASRPTTTAAPVTTTAAPPATAAPTTAKPTTTAAPKKAKVDMVVYLDEESTTQFSFEVDPGTALNTANLRSHFPAEYRDEMVSSPYADVPVAAEDGSYQFYIIVE